MDKKELEQIVERYNRSQGQIIAILHEIQDQERYLPENDLRYVAEKLNMSVAQIYHIATFYKAFSLKPKGRHICNVCMGTACHVRGAPLVLEELERKLGIKAGDTTPDMEYSITTVNCLGACALGPVVVVGKDYYGNMTPAKVERMLKEIKAKSNGGAKTKVQSEPDEDDDSTGEEKSTQEITAPQSEVKNEKVVEAKEEPEPKPSSVKKEREKKSSKKFSKPSSKKIAGAKKKGGKK